MPRSSRSSSLRRWTCLLIVLTSGLAGCEHDTGATDVGHGANVRDAYWSECPDVPVFARNLDAIPYRDEAGHPSPKAAVRSVADAQTEVVAIRTTGRSAEVDVRLGGDSGTFLVEKRPSGWLIGGGEGCAAWPAGEELLGPMQDCDEEFAAALEEYSVESSGEVDVGYFC